MLQSKNISGPVVLISKDIIYTFPFGYAYLAGYLRQQSEAVKMLFRPRKRTGFKEFVRQIIELKPLIVGFGTLYPDLYDVKELINLLNQTGRDFPIVIGGQMVTPTPEFAIKITGADYGVIGEGEIILYQLVKTLREQKSTSRVKGLIIRDGDQVILTGAGQYIEDLSKLPPIPYDLFPKEKWLNIGQFYIDYSQPHWRYNDRVVFLHGGRGCPFNCNFCYHSSRPRYRAITDIMADAKELIERYNANMLYFGDDLTIASPARARELTEAIKKLNRPVEYSVSARFDILERIDDELLREMKRTGCRIMGPGVESGSQRILDIMHKRITVEQIITGLQRLKDVGILPTAAIMVGQLNETMEDVKASMDIMLKTLRNDKNINYAFAITTPFPGSELYSIAKTKGIIKNDFDFYKRFNPDKELGAVSVNLSSMTDQQVETMRNQLEKTYKQEKKKLIGKKVIVTEILRHQVFRVYNKLNKLVLNKLPDNKTTMPIKKFLETMHNWLQLFLDNIRLYFLGVK